MILSDAQTKGVEWIDEQLKKYQGVILADRIGMGKSAQAIHTAARKVDLQCLPCLIIAPAYLVENWVRELELWGQRSVCVIDSAQQIIPEGFHFYLMSYNRAVSKPVFQQLFPRRFSLIICDESHYLKTWNSTRSRYILGTFKNKRIHYRAKADNMLLLSGTPIINNVEDIYNVVIRIAGAALDRMTREEFIYRYAGQVWHTPYGLKHQGVKNEAELKERLSGVMLSRSNIEGLPERIDEPILLSAKSPEVRNALREEEKFLRDLGITEQQLEHDLKINSIDAARISEVRQRLALAKIPVILDAIGDILENDGQLLVFCAHRAVQSALVEKLTAVTRFSSCHGIINGSTSMKKRQETIDEFQAGKKRMIVATIDAMKEGVNLTAGSYVLFLEWPWTSAAVDQCVGRCHRRGQTETVIAKHFLFDGGLDKHIYKLVNRKREAISKLI